MMLPKGTQGDAEESQEDGGAIGLVHTNCSSVSLCVYCSIDKSKWNQPRCQAESGQG